MWQEGLFFLRMKPLAAYNLRSREKGYASEKLKQYSHLTHLKSK